MKGRQVDPVDYEHVFKIVIIGNANVGKTSLLGRYVDGDAPGMNYSATLGVEYKIKTIEIPELNTVVKLQFWDTSGQERFATMTKGFWRGSHGVVLVFGLDDAKSFQDIDKRALDKSGRTIEDAEQHKSWLDAVEEHVGDACQLIILVGNKCDLDVSDRQVQSEDAEAFAKMRGLRYIETSAKTEENVHDLFFGFALDLTRKAIEKQRLGGNRSFELDPDIVSFEPAHLRKNTRPGGGCGC